MRFGCAASLVHNLARSLSRLCDQAEAQLADRPDLVLVFVSAHLEDDAPSVVSQLCRRYPSAVLAGCSAEGVIGQSVEYERQPAVSLALGKLPGVHLVPLRADAEDLAHPQAAADWMDNLHPPPADKPRFLLFGDPFSVPIDDLLKMFDHRYPKRAVLGGMVSGCEAPGQSVLILDDRVYRDGAVGVALTGGLRFTTVVSQGCRPIGERLVVTEAHNRVIHKLGGVPAMQKVRELLQNLSGDELAMARQSLFVGRVINEYKREFKRGDFLIRNILAGDPNSGAILVGDDIRVGASIQFHVRDATSADEDLREMLSAITTQDRPAGALLFTCNGRGTRMWPQPNHDVSVLQEICGPVPLAGFFAAGELGPLNGRNFIHGHTASIGLFYAQS